MADNTSGFACRLNIIREPAFAEMTQRKREICWDFGIPPREAPQTIATDLDIVLRPGTITLISGPSGSGKSTILQNIAEKVGRATWVGRGKFPVDRAIVDSIVPRRPLAMAMEILTACGLGEPRLWIRRFSDLSDGERFRATLAKAIGEVMQENDPASMGSGERESPLPHEAKPSRPVLNIKFKHTLETGVIFCDEFTAILHRRLAKALAYDLRKLVTRNGLILVVATTHDDIIEDLQADQIIRLGGGGQAQIIRHDPRLQAMSLRRRVSVEPGSVRDYHTFAPMHYRHRDGLGFVDKVFLLRESSKGDPLGILVYAHAPMELHLRNLSTRGRFVRNVRRLNRELRILRRLVMHPDVRGCGLGHWFVQQTLPQVGVRFIECLAAMGEVNPVFEKAGMQRIGRCPLPAGRLALLKRLQEWGIDPFSTEFPRKMARYPRVQKLVESTILKWVAATHGTAKYKLEGKSSEQLSQVFRQLLGKPPIYYLWDSEREFPDMGNVEEVMQRENAPSSAQRHSSDDEVTAAHRNKKRHRP